MARIDRNTRFELSEPDTGAARPQIWVEGRQKSRFDFRAYAVTSLGMAKRDLRPEIKDSEVRLAAFGKRVLGGEIRLNKAWAGWAEPVLPSHRSVGTWVLGLAATFAEAGHVLSPRVAGDGEMARSDVDLKPGAPHVAAKKAPAGSPDAATEAIRKMKRSIPNTRALELGLPEIAPQIGEGDAAFPRAWLPDAMRRVLRRVAGHLLLWILLAFALPVGAIKALIFHLNGGDLADWS